MATKFQIPKMSDREIVQALGRIRKELEPIYGFKFVVHPPQKAIELPKEKPENEPALKYVLDEESQVIATYQFITGQGHEGLRVQRQWDQITDAAVIPDEWISHADQGLRNVLPQLIVRLTSLIRIELKVSETEAALKGHEATPWNRYRDAQMALLNSLQQATETLIVQASQKNAELDKARSERFEKLEADLRAQLDKERKTLQVEHDSRLESLRTQEKTLSDKESAFNTKESQYVARQKQTEQIEKIQSWLDNWSLTKGTSRKRWPIATAYVIALLFTGGLTIYASWHSYELLRNVDEIVKLAWWQWAGIWAKSFFPLAAFVTFMIYFIRWSGDWARQHSEEEFRNRTRLVDIGRSSWLLEAVRDAQERNKEIPTDLLRELSRNLFASSASVERDIHPQAGADLLLQGLSSLRVKASDGTEVEATRGKKK